MWMAGFGMRDRPGDEIIHPIHAKALAIEDKQGKVAVIVTLDLLGIPRVVREAVEEQVKMKYDISPSYLLLNASHTHYGPEVRGVETFFDSEDPERTEQAYQYRDKLERKIVEVIGDALNKMKPAELGYARASAGFAMSRREFQPRPYTEGPVDHDVPILEVTGTDGSLMAVLFGYAVHPSTIHPESASSYAFNGDYAGFAQSYIEEANPGAVALFMAGAGGDQTVNPRHKAVGGLNGLDLAKMHGRTLALAVEAARNAHPTPIEPKLESTLEDVQLRYLSVPSREELEQNAESSNQTDRENAQVLLELLDREGSLPTHYSYPVQVMGFGDELTLVALASEVVVDYSVRLKRELSAPNVWVAGYSNDFMGYIPSYRIWQEGGYEGGRSMTFSKSTMYRGAVHPSKWAPTVESKIIYKVHELDGRIKDRLR